RQDAPRELRLAAVAAALVVLTIGVVTLAEYALSLDLRIDRILPQFLALGETGERYPGRRSPPTALAISLLSAALLFFDVRPRARARPSEWLALCAFFTAFAALVG